MSFPHNCSNMQTKILIDKILRRRKNDILIILFYQSYLRSDFAFPLIIHDNDRTGNNMITQPFLLGQILLYQETNCL